jgi:hypothetical protein
LAVVSRMLEQSEALKMYFRLAAYDEDKLNRLSQIVEGLNNSINKMYYTFLSYILPQINKINVEFLSEASQLPYLYDNS